MPTIAQQQQSAADAEKSLKRVQDFNPESIARIDELGKELNFTQAIPAVRRIVNLFRQISPESLQDFSQSMLNAVKQNADAQYNTFSQFLSFSLTGQDNPLQVRNTLLQQVDTGYDNLFQHLLPAIGYSARRSTDFARLEQEARAAIQAIDDKTNDIAAAISEREKEAEAALEAIRKVAEEQGVAQQAHYFKSEATHHTNEADNWLRRTRNLAFLLGAYAASTLFLHKIPLLAPDNEYEVAQLVVSKVLMFATLSYLVLLAARNFMAHRHNAVINKHKQNSLMTYRALVEAAGDLPNREIVLTRAADSIFSAQATGFAKESGDDGKPLTMVNLSSGIGRGGAAGG